MDNEPQPSDAYPPQEIARKVERLGIAALVMAALVWAIASWRREPCACALNET